MGEIYGRLRDQTTAFSKRIAALAQRLRRERKVPRVELFALRNFVPAEGHRDQLPFSADDVFLLKSDSDSKWWLVKHLPTGKKGYVPMNFVARTGEREHLEWYDTVMSRDEAIRILSNERYGPGAFIIRPKEYQHFSVALALTVKAQAAVENETKTFHYVIHREDGVFRIDGGKRFLSITQLVQYYAGNHGRMKQLLTFSVKKNKAIEIWEIDPSELEIEETHPLGDGFFGTVHKASWYGQTVAVKSIKLCRMSVDDFMKEADIAREFSHEHIVKILGVCSKRPYIITEFLPSGSLKDYLMKTQLLAADFVPIALKIASAMAHLESRGFVHRDLAARNILVGETHETIKLADFGMTRRLADSEYYKTDNKIFPYKWTPPEGFVIDGNSVCEAKMGKFTPASDVWSFAVVLWELYSKGAEPYHGFGSKQIYDKLRVDNYRLPCPTACPPVMYEKMLECWALDPTQRPTFAQLYTFLLDPYATTAAVH